MSLLQPHSRRVCKRERSRSQTPTLEPKAPEVPLYMEMADAALAERIGQAPELPDTIMVSISDDAFEKAGDWGDDAQRALELLPGKYFCIGLQQGGSAVYRQEPYPGQLNEQQLFLYYYHVGGGAGWYFSHKLDGSEDSDFVAWSREAPAGTLHVPWWAKQPCEGVSMMPFHEYAEIQVAQLMDEVDKLQAELVQQQGQGGRRSPDRAGPRGSC